MADARIVRRGEGEVLEPWTFKNSSRIGGSVDFMIGEIAHHTGPPLHVHREQHDTFYVLEGVLTIQVRDELTEIGPGDFATVPPGIPHTFDNVHADQPPVRVVNLMTPAGLDRFFVGLVELGGSPATVDRARLVELAERCGVSFVGPTIREKLGLV